MEFSTPEQEEMALYPVVKHAFKLSRTCMNVCLIDDFTNGEVTEENLKCFKGCTGLYSSIKDSYKSDFKQFFEKTHEFLNEGKIVKE